MQWLVAAVVVAVRVYLDHKRKTLDSLLRGEVCTQTVDCDEDLQRTQRRDGGHERFPCFSLNSNYCS